MATITRSLPSDVGPLPGQPTPKRYAGADGQFEAHLDRALDRVAGGDLDHELVDERLDGDDGAPPADVDTSSGDDDVRNESPRRDPGLSTLVTAFVAPPTLSPPVSPAAPPTRETLPAAAANDRASVDPAAVAEPVESSGVPLPSAVVPVSATKASALADSAAVDLVVGGVTAVELPTPGALAPPEHPSAGRFPLRPSSTNPVATGAITGLEEVISASGSVAAEIAAGTDAHGTPGADTGADDATDGSSPSHRDGGQSRTTSTPADGQSLQPVAARAGRPAASFPAGERDADGSGSMTASAAARVTGPPLSGVSLSLPSLSVDLSEEGLGPLRLRALNGAGVVHLELTASDPAITDLLVRAGHELRRDLEASGTAVGDLHIAQGNAGGGDRGSSGSDGRYWQDASSDDQPRSAPATTPGNTRRLVTLDHPATGRSDSSTAPSGVDLLI